MSDDCQELKNIKYKTMLLSGVETKETKENVSDLDLFIEKERLATTKLPWSKLEKGIKLHKLNTFADYYSKNNKLSQADNKLLRKTLKDALEKKQLNKAGIVIYDKNKELISNITNLIHNKSNKTFIIKDNAKRITTSKSLAPKKPRKTRRVEPKNEVLSKTSSNSKKDKEKIDIV